MNCLPKIIVGNEAPKDVLERCTIKGLEFSFIEVSAVMYSLKK